MYVQAGWNKLPDSGWLFSRRAAQESYTSNDPIGALVLLPTQAKQTIDITTYILFYMLVTAPFSSYGEAYVCHIRKKYSKDTLFLTYLSHY